MTNADAHRQLGPGTTGALCEWEPSQGRLARLADPYHAVATAHISAPGGGSLRVCRNCSQDATAKVWAKLRIGGKGW